MVTFAMLLGVAPGPVAQGTPPQALPAPDRVDPEKPVPGGTADLADLQGKPAALDFGAVAMGARRSLELRLRNRGSGALELRRLGFLRGASGDSMSASVQLAGRSYAGHAQDVVRMIYPPVLLEGGAELVALVTYEPIHDQLDEFVLRWIASDATLDVPVRALGGHHGDQFLHVVIDGPAVVVDYDRDGEEPVLLDGSTSHTHEPGHQLAAFEWSHAKDLLATTPTLATLLTQPVTELTLTITDDGDPPGSLAGGHAVVLAPPERVPGVFVRYHPTEPGGAAALLDGALPPPRFVEARPRPRVTGSLQVGGSPFGGDVLVAVVAQLSIESPGLGGFELTGGAGRRVFLDDQELTEPVLLLPGEHALELRFAVDSLDDLPLDVALVRDGLAEPIAEGLLAHDQTREPPVVHALSSSSPSAGEIAVTLEGFGFFPPEGVVVRWGSAELEADDLALLTPARIELRAPPGAGTVDVSVVNASGESASVPFEYPSELPPVAFRRERIVTVPAPTAGVFASDGRLYVIALDGRLTALEFDESYGHVELATFAGVSGLPNPESLALCVNPHDPPDPVRLYVGHGDLFLHDGQPPDGPSPYTGQISVLTGPDFDDPVPLVTGLPVSNNSHGINGMAFDDNGDLLVSVGSMTNAGVQHVGLGGLPESPLSAAVLKVRLSRPGFVGAVRYVETETGLPNDDQRSGERVDVVPGVDVEVHAPGFRNAFDLVYTTRGRLYATDNGPNVGYGPASTGPDSTAPDPMDTDELDLVERGNYYGLPNRARGRSDPRQNVYHGSSEGPPSLPDTLFQMIAALPSSCDGIDEYRADTFAGQMRGELIVQKYLGRLLRLRLGPDGRVLERLTLVDPTTRGLGCVVGPGGALVSLDHDAAQVEVLVPSEEPAGLVVLDVFPWRAPAVGGAPFLVTGHGFGTLADTTVRIGGRPAELTAVTGRSIRGRVPAALEPTPALLDIEVMVGPNRDTLPEAFRYLLAPGEEPGRWERLEDAGVALAAVAAGVIEGELLLVGSGGRRTHRYDLLAREWLPSGAPRPFLGLYHAAEVIDGRLYLVGGLGGGSEGRLQIYDPATDAWTTGADLPWSGGAVATAVLGGRLHAAGGYTPSGVERRHACYDPATDTWHALAPMPLNVSHAAAGTDGLGLYVFGGRRLPQEVAPGLDTLQIYDPVTDEWRWSGALGSLVAALPEPRSGMGKAVFLEGEFHLFGGETLDDPDAGPTGVYERVDVYDPRTNTWRREAPLPNPRHGICPVPFQGWIFVAGGSPHSGYGSSRTLECFTRQ
ncbi:MAG TPA: IPT/TIG domain-containing protein [Planctomycetota bacterium]